MTHSWRQCYDLGKTAAKILKDYWQSGLPDGLFFEPKIPIWLIFGLSCFKAFWYLLWPLGIF
jgi:hypothetical protein